MAVSKEYSAAGVAGFIQDVAKTVAGVASDAAHGAVGAVLALGAVAAALVKKRQLRPDE